MMIARVHTVPAAWQLHNEGCVLSVPRTNTGYCYPSRDRALMTPERESAMPIEVKSGKRHVIAAKVHQRASVR
jgi:hypothetical protein